MTPLPSAPGTPVVDGVGRIPGFVNCYTYADGDEIVLIDTGFSRNAAPVVHAFEAANVPIARVSKIVLSHHHVDHMGGAAYLVENIPAPLACHADDAPYVEGRVKTPMPPLMRLFVRVRSAPVAITLHDGDQVGPLRVVHTPGHTPGEVVFFHPSRKILFSGDAVVERKGRLTLGAPRFASNLEQAVESLWRIRDLGAEILLPGHGIPLTEDVGPRLQDLMERAPGEFLRRATR